MVNEHINHALDSLQSDLRGNIIARLRFVMELADDLVVPDIIF